MKKQFKTGSYVCLNKNAPTKYQVFKNAVFMVHLYAELEEPSYVVSMVDEKGVPSLQLHSIPAKYLQELKKVQIELSKEEFENLI